MTQVSMKDKVQFKDNGQPKTYTVEQIGTKSMDNPIWRNGFFVGVASGGAIVLLIMAAIIQIV